MTRAYRNDDSPHEVTEAEWGHGLSQMTQIRRKGKRVTHQPPEARRVEQGRLGPHATTFRCERSGWYDPQRGIRLLVVRHWVRFAAFPFFALQGQPDVSLGHSGSDAPGRDRSTGTKS